MTDKELTEEQKANIQRDIGLTDCLVRIQALETLLKSKGIIQDTEYNSVLENILTKMDEKLKEINDKGISNLMNYKANDEQKS